MATDIVDDFRGDTPHLVSCIRALLNFDARGALAPHGIGGHARDLLSAAAVRLAALQTVKPQAGSQFRPSVGTASMYAQQHGLAVTTDWMIGWNACLDAIDAAESPVTPAQAAIDAREREPAKPFAWVAVSRDSHGEPTVLWNYATQSEWVKKRDLDTSRHEVVALYAQAPRDAAPAPAAAGGVTGKPLQDVYMALAEIPCECSTRRREEGEHLSGCYLFDLVAAVDALAQPAPVQPNDGCEVNEYSSRVCERGTRSCTVSHEAAPVQQEAAAEAFEAFFFGSFRDAGFTVGGLPVSSINARHIWDAAIAALTPPAVAAPAQAGETGEAS